MVMCGDLTTKKLLFRLIILQVRFQKPSNLQNYIKLFAINTRTPDGLVHGFSNSTKVFWSIYYIILFIFFNHI